MSENKETIKYGLVVHTHSAQSPGSYFIAVMGAHGGEPTQFETRIQFKVGDWCGVNTVTRNVTKEHPLTKTEFDGNGMIKIKSYLVRFHATAPGIAMSPHVGPVIVPASLNFKSAYVFEASITCYVNSPEYKSLINDFSTGWKLSEYAEILQVEGLNRLTEIEKLVIEAGWKDEIELKPRTLDPKDVIGKPQTDQKGFGFNTQSKEVPTGFGASTQSKEIPTAGFGASTQSKEMPTGFGTNAQSKEIPAAGFGASTQSKEFSAAGFGANNASFGNQKSFGFSKDAGNTQPYRPDSFEFRGSSAAVTAAATAATAAKPADPPIPIDPEYPALGVVVSVQAEYIIVYSREGGNVYVDKSVLTTKQKFELTSCNWVKFMAAPNENRARHEFKFKIVRIKGVEIKEVDVAFRRIEWAVANVINSIKLSNATLYFKDQGAPHGEGTRIAHRRPGEAIVYHPFVGEVLVEDRAWRSINMYRLDFDATVELARDGIRTVWRVSQFVYDGQELTLNGYMSKIGHGKWQQVRDANLPRLAQQKEKNLTTKNSAPAPNAAVKGSLGWHIPTMPDPFGEAADEAEGAPGGDIGADNPAEYGDVLRITPSILAPKVEFNRIMMPEDPEDIDHRKRQVLEKMRAAFKPDPEPMPEFTNRTTDGIATYSMPPAVTTMPMKMKNDWMGTEGGWRDRDARRRGTEFRGGAAGGGGGVAARPASVAGWAGGGGGVGGGTVDNRSVMSRMSSATRGGGDDVWYDNEYKLDDKGKKKPDGWEQVTSLGMVVSADNGSFVVWMREQNKVISVRSRELYLLAWADITYNWHEEKRLISLKNIAVAAEEPEEIVPEIDDATNKVKVSCVIDFIASVDDETPASLKSPVLGAIEVHESEVHEKIWYEEYFMKKLEIEAEFRLEKGEEGEMSGQWVMTNFLRVVGAVSEKHLV